MTNGISTIINESANPEEVKTDLQFLLKVAKKNIDIFDKIYPLIFTDGAYNGEDFFYECIPVMYKNVYVKFQSDLVDYEITDDDFKNRCTDYKKNNYVIQEFYLFSSEFVYRANEKIGDWVKEKDLKLQKAEEEVKSLRREWMKFYLGLALGFISSVLMAFLTFYLSHR